MKQKTKLDLDRAIADSLKVHRSDVSKITAAFLEQIVKSVIADGRIELRSFGVLRVCDVKPRQARNPKTGKTLTTRAKRVVRFRCSTVFSDLVNRQS